MSKSVARWSKIAIGLYLCAAVLASLPVHAASDDQTTAAEPQASTPVQEQAPVDAPAPAPVVGADGMTVTASGLKYLDLAPGKGEPAKVGDMIWVHYTGWLQAPNGKKGKKFDSSLDRHDPLSLKLGAHQVISGWEEGLNGLPLHAKRRLVIPPNLGYGAKGAGKGIIPPNATLIFDVEMVKIAR